MWGATAQMAKKIAGGVASVGVPVKLFDVALSERTEIIKDMLGAQGYIFESSTHNKDMLPGMAEFLAFFKGLKPKNRMVAVFGSYGWAGGAVKSIEDILKEAELEPVSPGFSIQYRPHEDELKRCFEFGRDFAKML
jgi:flavorubredoxin